MFVVILGFFQFFLIASITFYEFKKKSTAVFLWATLLLLFGLMHFFSVISDVLLFPTSVMNHSSLFVIGFCFFYFITRMFLGKIYKGNLNEVFYIIRKGGFVEGEYHNNKHLYIIFYLVVIYLCFAIINFSGGFLNTSWGSKRLFGAGSYITSVNVLTIVYYSLGGLLACSLIQKDKTNTIICSLLMTFTVLVLRSRILILPLMVSCLSYFLFKLRKIGYSQFIRIIISAVVIVFVIYGIRVFRYYGTFGNALDNLTFSALVDRILIFIMEENGELGLRKYFYYFVQNDNNFQDFGKGYTYLRMLLVIIPSRLSFGLKPNDFAVSMGRAVGMPEGGSMHPTLFGDVYANFDDFGIFAGIIWAVLVTLSDILINSFRDNQYKVLLFVLFSFSFVIIARGSVYNAFFDAVFGLLFLCILTKFSRYKILFGSNNR